LHEEVEERERTLTQLMHSQRVDAVGRATAGLAHDFDNILNVVLGYASEREKLADWGTPALLNALEGVELAALRGLAINRKLLNFSRRDTGPAQVVDLATVLRELEPMLRQLLGRYIQPQLQIHDDNVFVWFDRSQFELVVLNMASNARDAMPEGGRFTLFLEKSTDGLYAELTLTDTGKGMSNEVQAKVFEQFYTTKPFGTGTGLGLSVVASIVQAAKGRIDVASSTFEGTQFRITLPLYREPVTPATETG
jgi:signal transduction histidine kinase